MTHAHDHADGEPCSCGCDKFAGSTFNVHLQASESRHVMHLGRDHIVVPVIMARADVVMNGSLVPVEELFPEAWNGVPVTVGHPVVGEGFSTANDPDILTNWAIGQIFNARLDDHILKGEAWIDVERSERVRPGLIAQLEQGTAMDVSTGYFSKKVKARGNLNGRRYELVDREINPDHLALLPDEIGACSWDDGCGVRTNRRNSNMNESTGGKAATAIAAVLKRFGVNKEKKLVEGQEPTANMRGEDDDPVQIMADLISSDASPFTPNDFYGLQGLSVDTLIDLRDMYLGEQPDPDAMAANAKVKVITNQKEPIVGDKDNKEPSANAVALPTTVGELNTLIANAVAQALPGALTEALKPVTASMQTNALSADDRTALATAAKITADHKTELVTKITTNTKITKEAAEAMPLATLEIIANGIVVPVPDYGGRFFGGNRLAAPVDNDPAIKAMVPPTTKQAIMNARKSKEKVN